MSRNKIAIILTDTHLKENNLKDVESVFIQTINYCKENNQNTIYHLGDIFDSRKAQTLLVLESFRSILDSLLKNRITLIAICGNHEKTSYEEEVSFLHPFSTHPSFKLFDRYFKIELERNIVFHFLPYFSDFIYTERLTNIKVNSKQINLLFTHIGITGAVMNNGQQVDGISVSNFNLFQKVISGHYHDKQIFGENDKFNYIGSSIQHNYGETPDKGLTVIYDDLSWRTVELEFPKYLKLEVDIDKLTPSEIEAIKRAKEVSKDNLRVILYGSEEKVKSFNKNILTTCGISVEQKVDKIDKQEVDQRIEPYTSKTLLSEFEVFCERNNLDRERGLKYLKDVV